MAISDTITSMYENVGNVYDVLELAGADLTNVDKNIENLKQSWEERLLYFLANGTDVVWNNWLPKVTGTGENITLNNTIEAKMDFVYKGNTSQYSTTGKNLYDKSKISSVSGGTNNNGIITATNGNCSVFLSSGGYIPVNNGETIYFSADIKLNSSSSGVWNNINDGVNGGTKKILTPTLSTTYQRYQTSFTYSSNRSIDRIFIQIFNLSGSIEISNIMISKNNNANYEPYTNGASPNPDYPQDIQVVSGDNTIKIQSKNIFDGEFRQGSWNNTTSTDRIFSKNQLFLKRGTTCTFETDLDLTTYNFGILVNDSSFPVNSLNTSIDSGWLSTNTYTFTTTRDGYFGLNIKKIDGSNINVSNVENSNFVLYNNSQTYPINLGNIELCKIGDYQDKIAKSTGKNLFKEWISGTVNVNTGEITSVARNRSDYIEVKPNTTYTMWRDTTGFANYMIEYNSSKTYIQEQHLASADTSGTFTTSATTKYVILYQYTSYTPSNKELFEEGNITTPVYEPYGKVWYLNKQIGKVVLDGSESWNSYADGSDYFYRSTSILETTANYVDGYSSHFRCLTYYPNVAGTFAFRGDGKQLSIRVNGITSVAGWKTWLSTHNTIVYYVLATPTYEEITDTTLISQLEAIKKSYNTQTNISQENNDLPFELDVVALGKLS